jgi:probable rRNA maturation factor
LIVFTDDKELRRLNKMYRRMDRTTDVLSFNIPRLMHGGRDTGELYLSVPQAARQARRRGHSLAAELQVLIVHGALHLSGHDHKRPRDTARMRARERHYLKGLAE